MTIQAGLQAMKLQDLKVGARVILEGHGKPMTVTHVNLRDGWAECFWYGVHKTAEMARLPLALLRVLPETKAAVGRSAMFPSGD